MLKNEKQKGTPIEKGATELSQFTHTNPKGQYTEEKVMIFPG